MASITDKLLKSQFKSNLEKQQNVFEKNAEKQAQKEGKLSSFMRIATPLAGLALMATPLGPLMATAGSALGGSLGLGAAASTALGTGIAKAGTSYLGSLASEEGARAAGMGAESEEEQRKSLESQTAALGPIGRKQMEEGLDRDLQVTQEKARQASGDSRAIGALASGVTGGMSKYAKLGELGDIAAGEGADLAVDTGMSEAAAKTALDEGTSLATSEGVGTAGQQVSLLGTSIDPLGSGEATIGIGEKFGEMGNIFDTSSDWWGMGTENWGEAAKGIAKKEGLDYVLTRQDGGIVPSLDARDRDNTDFYRLYL